MAIQLAEFTLDLLPTDFKYSAKSMIKGNRLVKIEFFCCKADGMDHKDISKSTDKGQSPTESSDILPLVKMM